LKAVLTVIGHHRRHEFGLAMAERVALGNRRLLAAGRAMDALSGLKALFKTKIEHARLDPRFRRIVFNDIGILLRVEHGFDDEQERKDIIRRIAELTASDDVIVAAARN
jgi:hypothetical protein